MRKQVPNPYYLRENQVQNQVHRQPYPTRLSGPRNAPPRASQVPPTFTGPYPYSQFRPPPSYATMVQHASPIPLQVNGGAMRMPQYSPYMHHEYVPSYGQGPQTQQQPRSRHANIDADGIQLRPGSGLTFVGSSQPAYSQILERPTTLNRALDDMELQQLKRNFLDKYPSIIEQLTFPEVKEIVRLLYSKDLFICEEKERVELVTNTPTEAATILIDYILKKNEKRLYCAFIEILHTMPSHVDLVTALTS